MPQASRAAMRLLLAVLAGGRLVPAPRAASPCRRPAAPCSCLQAVSGRVNATFAPHTQYQIAADNEHVFYISREQLSAARLLATVRQGGGA